MKPITEKDLGLTPEEVKDLVKGAQKYLPPTDEDGNPILASDKSDTNPKTD